jgi:hypothetical protein
MHPVQSTNLDSLLHGGSAQSQALELLKRNQSVLAGSNLSYLPLPRRRGPPPTGRKVHSGSTFRPVGGGGWGGHALEGERPRRACGARSESIDAQKAVSGVTGARLANAAAPPTPNPSASCRGAWQKSSKAPKARGPAIRRGPSKATRLLGRGYARAGVVTSSRPCPACRRRASRPVPSPAAPRSLPR